MEKVEFSLDGQDYIELLKLLKALYLVGTGGEAKIRIDSGEVIRNGEVETRKRAKLIAGDVIEFADQEITIKA